MPHAFLKASDDVQVIQRCTKIQFASRREAFKVRGKMRKDVGVTQVGKGKINVYFCKVCAHWHVGHLRD